MRSCLIEQSAGELAIRGDPGEAATSEEVVDAIYTRPVHSVTSDNAFPRDPGNMTNRSTEVTFDLMAIGR